MKRVLFAAAAGLVIGLAAPSMADDRVDHFAGEPAETLDQALANFSEYNTRLEAVLEKETLDFPDMRVIHELTYTLENALEKIREDMAVLAETLEALHLASETGDEDGSRRHGEAYLETARLIRP